MKKVPLKKDKQKRKGSIKTGIVALLVISLLCSVSITLIFMCRSFEDTLTKTTQENMVDYVTASSSKMKDAIKNITNQIKTVDHEQSLYEAALDPSSNIKWTISTLNDFVKENPSFYSAELLDLEGNLIATGGENKATIDYKTEDFVQQIIKGEESAESDLYTTSEGKTVLAIAIPIYNGNNTNIGILVGTVDVSEFAEEIKAVKMSAIHDMIAYLVDENGKVITHTKEEKVGTVIQNSMIVKALSQKEKNSSGAASYEEGSDIRYAGYTTLDNGWVFVVAVSKEEVFAPVKKMQMNAIFMEIIIVLLCSFIAYLFAGTIVNPIKKTTKLLNKMAELNLKKENQLEQLATRNDETGIMCTSIDKMSNQLRNVIGSIGMATQEMNITADQMAEVSDQVNSHTNSNTSNTQQIAAAMEETAATTEEITKNIGVVKNSAEEISDKVQEGTILIHGIMDRAVLLKNNTIQANGKIQTIFEEVKGKSDLAIEKSKAVSRINELTDNINQIADQTSLLALNASIEAARAGDAGKGFAVVAGEVGNLAKQSTSAVENISEIVNDVNEAVNSMSECLNQMLDFVEKAVISDYGTFIQVSEQYNQDAKKINGSMVYINQAVTNLTETMESMADAIENINQTVNDSSDELGTIAQSNTEILGLTEKTLDMAKNSKNAAEKLQEIVSVFQL